MFAKQYKLKSNNTLKNSEKKHLAQRLQDEFPGVTEEKVKELVPVKSTSSCMKVVLHSGETVGVYVVDGVPMIIEDERGLVPTVCALWKVPDLVPTLIIHTPVLPKMVGGAPLYLPGLVRGAGGAGWGAFPRGGAVAASTQDNAAAAIVGRALLSSDEMRHLVAGVCLETVQVFGDLLCKENKFNKIERPKLGPACYPNEDINVLASDLNQLSVAPPPVKEEWPSLGRPAPAAPSTPALFPPAPNQPALIPDAAPEPAPERTQDESELEDTMLTESSQPEDPESGIPSDMEGLLRWCLLSLLKLRGKHLPLPLKTNLLYKNYLMPLCPPGRTLDVKKSSYKKMGKFLEAMQQEGLLEVRELEKGVDAVVGVCCVHPAVRHHSCAGVEAPEPRQPASTHTDYEPPQVNEVFCLTAHVLGLFPEHKKGSVVRAADIRAAVTEYVRARGLASDRVKGAVVLDATLAAILGKQEQEHVKWDEVMSAVQSKCTASTELRAADGGVRLVRSRLPPVTMQVATRSGNKKVTLVSNLEWYGFNLQSLAGAWQARAAAACGVTRAPGASRDQLLLQGDQTYIVAKLLIEEYGLPKKYVEGADKALKKKK